MRKDRLQQIINNFQGKKIAVLGDLMIDVYISGKASRISPEAPVPVLEVKEKSFRLGGAANVMLNVKTLGGEAEAFGITGDDANGKKLVELFNENDIRNDGVFADPHRRTTEKQRVIAASQQIVRIDFEDTFPVLEELSLKMLNFLVSRIESGDIDAVIFEDYAKGTINRDILKKVLEATVNKNIMTALDPHAKQLLEVPSLTLLKPNRSEAFTLAGMYCQDPVSPPEKDGPLRKAAEKLMSSWMPKYLLVSLGAQGLGLFDKSDDKFIPTRAKEVFDVSGAGDTVMSAFMLALLGGASGLEAAEISNHAAGIVVGKAGTATVSLEELKRSFEDE